MYANTIECWRKKNCYYVNGRSRNDLRYSQALQCGRRTHGGIKNNSDNNKSTRYAKIILPIYLAKDLPYYFVFAAYGENFTIENEN